MRILHLIQWLLVLSMICTYSGLASGNNQYLLSPPVVKKLVVGRNVHSFTERFYRPPLVVTLPVKQQDYPSTSPENVLLAYLSSLVTHDTVWYLSLAEKSEKEKARKNPKEFNKEMIDAFKQADDFLRNGTISLVRQELIGSKYAIIVFDVKDKNGDAILTLPFSFIREDDRWYDCQSCNSAPGAPLYDLLLNDNYDFEGTEKRISQ